MAMTEQDKVIKSYKKRILSLQQKISADDVVMKKMTLLLMVCLESHNGDLLGDMIRAELDANKHYVYKYRRNR